jgi:hypothetical protein
VPQVIVDGVFVSVYVSMWIFEGDWEVYIFPLCPQVELRREIDNRRVIGFDFENVCSDEKVGKLQVRTTQQRAVDWADVEGLTGERESHATAVRYRANVRVSRRVTEMLDNLCKE